MNVSSTAARQLSRDAWEDACGASAFVSFLVILWHVLWPVGTGLSIPYAGGGAVVVGIGATACLGLRTRGSRLAAAVVLAGLLGLRVVSALRPDLLIAKHGALSVVDGLALTLLFVFVAMIVVAALRTLSEPHKGMHRSNEPA